MPLTGRIAGAATLVLIAVAPPRVAMSQAPAGSPQQCDSLFHRFIRTPKNGAARSVCGVDLRPLPRALVTAANIPHWSGSFSAWMSFVVDRDGTVDSTSVESMGSVGAFINEHSPMPVPGAFLAALRAARFAPGMEHGAPVRTGVELLLVARAAPDSLPAVGAWRYVVGEQSDTLRLEWTAGSPLRVRNADESAAVLLVSNAELRTSTMEWRDRTRGWNGCSSIMPSVPFAEAAAEKLRRSRIPLAGDPGCKSADDPYGVRWNDVFRVSDSMFVARFTYPVGMEGWLAGRCWVERTARGWRAGCG